MRSTNTRSYPTGIRTRNTGLMRTPIALAIGLVTTYLTSPITMAQESKQPEEMVVTATRLSRSLSDIAGTVSVISDADIAHEVAEELNDLTRYMPGVTMNTAGRGGNQGFSIRGIGGNRVLTIIDGIRSSDIYAAGPSSYGKDSFEVDDLKAVEIIRGPASVLYGADAMGGAVILRSKEPRDYLNERDSYLSVRSSASSANDQVKLGATGAIQVGNVGLISQLTHRDFSERDISGAGKLNPQDGESDSVLFKSVWSPSEPHKLTITLDALSDENNVRLDSDLSGSVTQSIGRDETERRRISSQYIWLTENALFDELELDAHWQKTDALQHTEQTLTSYSFVNPVNPATFGGTQAYRVTDFEFNQNTRSAGILMRKSFANGDIAHTVVYGANWEQTDTERPRNRCDEQISSGNISCQISSYPTAPTENFPNKTFPDSETTRSGLYIQDEIVLNDGRLTFVPGIRFDNYIMDPSIDALLDGSGYIGNYGGFVISPVEEEEVSLSFGSIYDASEKLSFFAQYAEGYRPPNFDESNQAFVNLAHGYATVPNPLLEAESSKGLEIGARVSVGNANLSLAVYENHYDNFIESAFVGFANGIMLFQDQNIGNATISGAELTGSWYLTEEWQLRGSVAYAKGDDDENNVPLDSIDPLTAVAGIRFDDRNGKWGVETMLTAVAEKDRVSDVSRATASAYGVVDMLAYYNISQSSAVRLGLFNVFDRQYARWTNMQGLQATNLDGIAKAQESGRNFRLSINYQF